LQYFSHTLSFVRLCAIVVFGFAFAAIFTDPFRFYIVGQRVSVSVFVPFAGFVCVRALYVAIHDVRELGQASAHGKAIAAVIVPTLTRRAIVLFVIGAIAFLQQMISAILLKDVGGLVPYPWASSRGEYVVGIGLRLLAIPIALAWSWKRRLCRREQDRRSSISVQVESAHSHKEMELGIEDDKETDVVAL
jgi:hypothetical protein